MNEQKSVLQTAILANGCFWCTEAVFQRLRGVKTVVPGFTGGFIKHPPYREVRTGRTGHAEALRIQFDAQTISFKALLSVFFATHDPTTLNRQGKDVGTQYRSEIFYTNTAQKETAIRYIDWLTAQQLFDQPIVTAVTAAGPFYLAEEDHHNYYNNNQEQPYCQLVVAPKIAKLKALFLDKLDNDKL